MENYKKFIVLLCVVAPLISSRIRPTQVCITKSLIVESLASARNSSYNTFLTKIRFGLSSMNARYLA